MARSQTVKKKGRSSSSAKQRRAGARRRPATRAKRSTPQSQMAGSKGKGRGSGSRSMRQDDTGMKPEANQPPTLVRGDATVGEQRRASSGQRDSARTNRPEQGRPRKQGARGGGDFDRDQADADMDERQTAGRRLGRGDALESGRQDETEPRLESTRGARARGGEEGRRARARRATPDSTGADDDFGDSAEADRPRRKTQTT